MAFPGVVLQIASERGLKVVHITHECGKMPRNCGIDLGINE